ncbi:MAG TPA: Hsp20/alpha crystallin family protein [bacterium]|nr:Hsp20/alpha crystallin family protein [bacterium]
MMRGAPWWAGGVRPRLRWRHRTQTGWEPFAEFRFAPPVDLHETGESVVVTVDLPGVKREDLEISVEGDSLLVLKGRRSAGESQGPEYVCCERPVGRFAREIELPAPVDAGRVRATLRDGVLELILPKSRAALPHRIAVAAD